MKATEDTERKRTNTILCALGVLGGKKNKIVVCIALISLTLISVGTVSSLLASVSEGGGAAITFNVVGAMEMGDVPTADSLGVDSATGGTGTYVAVPVKIVNVANGPVQGFRLGVDYDDTVFELVNVSSGDLTSTWTLQLGADRHTIIIATAFSGDAIQDGSSGSIVLLNFHVIGASTSSALNMKLIEFSNRDGVIGTAPARNGTISVRSAVESTPGSSNGGSSSSSGGERSDLDSDSDGFYDRYETIVGTNPYDPCDPDSRHAACQAINPPSPSPEIILALPAQTNAPAPAYKNIHTPVPTDKSTETDRPAAAAPSSSLALTIGAIMVSAAFIAIGSRWRERNIK